MPVWDTGDCAAVRVTLAASAQRLVRAGADFFVCPDNTAHLALELPGPDLPLPGLHIAEVVAQQAALQGHTRVGVLGTRYTMDGPLYPRTLAASGIAAEFPDADDRHLVNRVVFEELVAWSAMRHATTTCVSSNGSQSAGVTRLSSPAPRSRC